MKTLLLLIIASTIPSLPASADAPWPEFRGPHGNGIADVTVAPTVLDETTLVWQTDLKGKGWSSPVVADGIVWVTTAIEVAPSPEEVDSRLAAAGIPPGQRDSRSIAASIRLRLIGLNLKDGMILHDILLRQYDRPDSIHALNSYASPTPVIDGDRIYCGFGTYGTFCVDRIAGQIVWQNEIDVTHEVGPGSSPIIFGDQLILIYDGMLRQRVVSLQKSDGAEIWQTERPRIDAPADGVMKKAFCTPVWIKTPNGREQLICLASQWMVSLDPKNGKELWRCYHGKGFSIVPRPVYQDGIIYFATGYGKPEFWAVDATGRGDVTQTHVQWRTSKGVPKKPSPILHDNLLYLVADNGVASCLDAGNGEEIWKRRIGGNYSASPILVGEQIYFCSQEGDVIVIQAGFDGKVIAENQLGQRILASPAAVADGLIIRTESTLRLYR